MKTSLKPKKKHPIEFFSGTVHSAYRLIGMLSVILLLVGNASNSSYAQFAGLLDSSSRVTVSATPQTGEVLPGADIAVAVVFDHEPNWHIHTNNPQVPPELGDASYFIKTQVIADLPEGSPIQVHTPYTQWPKPHTVQVAFSGQPVPYDVFSEKAVAYLPVTIAADTQPGNVTFTLLTTYQACDDTQCLAPVYKHPIEIGLTIQNPYTASSEDRRTDLALFQDFDPGVWQQIHSGTALPANVIFDLFGGFFQIDTGSWLGLVMLMSVAALGGFLLNLTPCVLPVIPLKVMGLSQAADTPHRYTALGLFMTLGVVMFWLTLWGSLWHLSAALPPSINCSNNPCSRLESGFLSR